MLMIEDACLVSVAKRKCLAIEERGTRAPTNSLPTPDQGQEGRGLIKHGAYLGKEVKTQSAEELQHQINRKRVLQV